MNIRIGFGVDVHQLADTHELFIGGKKIESDLGAVGHSDADVLLHAICDALLGAANLGDIGKHFPDTDSTFKNIDSMILLRRVHDLILEYGWKIGNIDTTLILEKPKVNPHIPEMQRVMAECLNIAENVISIKATTNEKLGFIGREEGVVAYAVCLLYKE